MQTKAKQSAKRRATHSSFQVEENSQVAPPTCHSRSVGHPRLGRCFLLSDCELENNNDRLGINLGTCRFSLLHRRPRVTQVYLTLLVRRVGGGTSSFLTLSFLNFLLCQFTSHGGLHRNRGFLLHHNTTMSWHDRRGSNGVACALPALPFQLPQYSFANTRL